MNIEEYISSGILETYLLGYATPEENREVENLASRYPEVKLELEQIEKAFNSYTAIFSIEPPSYLKDTIKSKILNKGNTYSYTLETNLRNLNIEKNNQVSNYSFWAIAASVLLLLSIAGNVYFSMKTVKMAQSLSAINISNNKLSDSVQNLTAIYRQTANDMAIFKDPMYKIVELKGMKVSPDARAMVCWCPMEKKVYVEIEKLPEPPQGMQYQLWAIVDGKPVNEGMLTMGNGLHRMPDIDKAQAFAVTLEKQGGSPEPKGDMYVMGSI
jgi:anti-sigma-K factor RskA